LYTQVKYTKNIAMDIFDNTILCKNCKKEMKQILVSKNGFNLRALRCPKCNETLVHPSDMHEYEEFMRLKNKEFEVKMRMVGNSYAVSIPREIVDFMKEQEKMINDMVRLSFEEAGRISLMFNTPEAEDARVVKAREVKIIKNNKPVFHARQVSDSANPKNNHTKVFKSRELEEK
jgi:hypothetical protein